MSGRYQPLEIGSGGTKSSSNKSSRWCAPRCLRLNAFTGALAMGLVLVSVWMLFGDAPPVHDTFPMSEAILAKACDAFTNLLPSSNQRGPDIPNLVHYVWLSKDPSHFQMGFEAFLSIYSSHLYMKPDQIHIHTDASPEAIERAKTSSEGDDVWTQRILSLSSVVTNPVTPPDVTDYGVPIDHMAHKSDFIRIDVLKQYGGIYLDTDVIPLRDMKPLREAGFAAVLGGASSDHMRFSGNIGNGVMLARKDSLLMHLWPQAMHRYFNGEWALASIYLLTDMADRLTALPTREILILHNRAFTPASWENADAYMLYKPTLSLLEGDFEDHYQQALGLASNSQGREDARCGDGSGWLAQSDKTRVMEKGEMDFSGSYTIHGFDSNLHNIWGFDGVIDLKYMLERRSNYARAIYPAVMHAIRTGVIEGDDALSS